MKDRECVKKRKIIKRFMIYSEIFTESNLNDLSLDELESLQKTTLIELLIKNKFKTRNNKNKS